MKITYRNLEEGELLTSHRLVMRTFDHLRERVGLRPLGHYPRKVSPLALHIYKHDPGGAMVAYCGKRMVGYAGSVVRKPQWYLAVLFVDPRYQGKGIGKELLRRSLGYGKRRGARVFSLCTYGYNPASLALYSSFGMVPHADILMMKGNLSGDPVLPAAKQISYRKAGERDLPLLSRIDREIRRIRREPEHLFWLRAKKHGSYIILEKGEPRGYVVLAEKGWIGPVAAPESKRLLPYLRIGMRISKEAGNREVRLFVVAKNREIVQFLLERGLRLEELLVLMSDKPFCDLSRYLPGNLALF